MFAMGVRRRKSEAQSEARTIAGASMGRGTAELDDPSGKKSPHLNLAGIGADV
jgi:hypothetical protein